MNSTTLYLSQLDCASVSVMHRNGVGEETLGSCGNEWVRSVMGRRTLKCVSIVVVYSARGERLIRSGKMMRVLAGIVVVG